MTEPATNSADQHGGQDGTATAGGGFAVRPLTLDAALHVAQRMRQSDKDEIFSLRWDEDPAELARDAFQRPCSWSAGLGGEHICVFGAVPLWPGVWECWMFATDRFDEIGRSLTRHVHRHTVPGLVRVGMHRIQCHSMEGNEVAHRWIESLGMTLEGRVPNFGKHHQPFLSYARHFGSVS